VFAPHLGGAEKKFFRYANLSALPLSYTPHFPNPRNIPGFLYIPLPPDQHHISNVAMWRYKGAPK